MGSDFHIPAHRSAIPYLGKAHQQDKLCDVGLPFRVLRSFKHRGNAQYSGSFCAQLSRGFLAKGPGPRTQVEKSGCVENIGKWQPNQKNKAFRTCSSAYTKAASRIIPRPFSRDTLWCLRHILKMPVSQVRGVPYLFTFKNHEKWSSSNHVQTVENCRV